MNVTANSMPFNITTSSNVIIKIQIKGEGNLHDGGVIPLSNVYVGQSSQSSNNDGIILGTSYKDWKKQIAPSEATVNPSYWFLSVPAGTPSGTYQFKFFIQVVF